jgi:phosphatidate phosphatase APP1
MKQMPTARRRVLISPYRGFGRPGELLIRGRVLADKHITRAAEAEPLWRNLINTYRRFQSDELAGARIVGTHRDAVMESVTDDEGFFQLRLSSESDSLWTEVQLHLPDHDVTATGHVLVPPPDAAFGIISDIDDTIVTTNATSLLGMARSILHNAAARLPFAGVADFYRALHAGRNPLFYVSSSPWNLYELLHDFMEINRIPHGPMLLQDWGIDEDTFILDAHATHKLAQIQTLFDYYPDLRFVLIGDSGQHDPEIYQQVMQTHPDRVITAIIRDVNGHVRGASEKMVFVRDSDEAAEHVQRLGLLS